MESETRYLIAWLGVVFVAVVLMAIFLLRPSCPSCICNCPSCPTCKTDVERYYIMFNTSLRILGPEGMVTDREEILPCIVHAFYVKVEAGKEGINNSLLCTDDTDARSVSDIEMSNWYGQSRLTKVPPVRPYYDCWSIPDLKAWEEFIVRMVIEQSCGGEANKNESLVIGVVEAEK